MKNNIRITLLGFLLCLLSPMATYAQTLGFNYQAIIKSQNTESFDFYGETIELNFVSSSDIAMRFSIIRNGETVYKEVHQTQTNEYGEVNLNIGSGETELGTFADIPWDGTPMQLSVEIDYLDGLDFQFAE